MIRKRNGPMVVLRHVGRPMGGGKGRGLIKPRPRKAPPIGLLCMGWRGRGRLRQRPLEAPPTSLCLDWKGRGYVRPRPLEALPVGLH